MVQRRAIDELYLCTEKALIIAGLIAIRKTNKYAVTMEFLLNPILLLRKRKVPVDDIPKKRIVNKRVRFIES